MSDHGNGTSPPGLAVIDIDGVLADVRHRLHHIGGPRRDWAGFFADMAGDELLADGASAVIQAHAAGLGIVYLTGRPERYRDQTLQWLSRADLPTGRLIMRPDHDRRPARAFKVEQLRLISATAHVDFLLDDDEVVCAAAERAGFTVRRADWVARDDVLRAAQDQMGRT